MAEKKKLVPLEVTGEGSEAAGNDHGTGQFQTSVNIAKVLSHPPSPPDRPRPAHDPCATQLRHHHDAIIMTPLRHDAATMLRFYHR